MTPLDIGPHPEAPNHYLSMGRPPSMSDDQCGSLSVRRVAATGDMVSEPAVRVVRQEWDNAPDLYPCYLSEWQPTPAELERMNAGLPVRMLIVGNGLPPVSLWVREQNEV